MPFADWFKTRSENVQNNVVRWIVGVAVVSFLSSGITMYKLNKSDKELAYMRAEKDTILQNYRDMTIKVAKLEAEIDRQKQNQYLLSLLENDLPYPFVMKTLDGMVVSLNKAYLNDFVTPYGFERSDYEGKYDKDFWGTELAQYFEALDRLAIKHNRPVSTKATFPNPFDPSEIIDRDVTVYPIRIKEGKPPFAIGVIINKEYK